MKIRSIVWILPLLLSASCSLQDDDPEIPAQTAAADAAMEETVGRLVPIGEFCVSEAQAFEAPRFVVYPSGCFSSSATRVHKSECSAAVNDDGTLVLSAVFRIEELDVEFGTPDCSGGGFAVCTANVASGSYLVEAEELSLYLTVPYYGLRRCAESP